MTKNRFPLYILVLALAALVLAACQPAPAEEASEPEKPAPVEESSLTPAVSVSDQEVKDGTVTIADVVSDGAGWLVIHAQADGKPGPILGFSPVLDGQNSNVVVEIDTAAATETLYAMLHMDAGEIGTFEFPDGSDGPVTVDGKVVTPPFAAAGLPTGESADMEMTPSVTAADQEILGGTVTIAEVVSNGAGWLVVHAQADGKPGPILGFSPVLDGQNTNVVVEIDTSAATETLYAMLHTDAGEVGTFEFPDGSDGPVTVDGKVVTPPFTASIPTTLLNTYEDGELGTFLIAEDGFSLYIFLNDEPGKSNCYDTCEANWPPLLGEGDLIAGEGVDASLLGTTNRNDGTTQVTYNGWPLYFFANDAGPGDVNGQNVFDVWFVMAPNGEYVMP